MSQTGGAGAVRAAAAGMSNRRTFQKNTQENKTKVKNIKCQNLKNLKIIIQALVLNLLVSNKHKTMNTNKPLSEAGMFYVLFV